MTIVDFLLARIDEDEAQAANVELFAFDPIEGRPRNKSIRERVLAECAAKRAIVEAAARMGDDGTYTADYMPAREPHPVEVGGRRYYSGHPNFVASVIYGKTLRHLAAVYADHPDYQEEWRPYPTFSGRPRPDSGATGPASEE